MYFIVDNHASCSSYHGYNMHVAFMVMNSIHVCTCICMYIHTYAMLKTLCYSLSVYVCVVALPM